MDARGLDEAARRPLQGHGQDRFYKTSLYDATVEDKAAAPKQDVLLRGRAARLGKCSLRARGGAAVTLLGHARGQADQAP